MTRVILFVLCFCTLSNCHSQVREEEKTENKTMNITDAVKNNQLQLVEKMLKEGADVNTQDKNKQSLLLIAAIAEAVDMAKLLSDTGSGKL